LCSVLRPRQHTVRCSDDCATATRQYLWQYFQNLFLTKSELRCGQTGVVEIANQGEYLIVHHTYFIQ